MQLEGRWCDGDKDVQRWYTTTCKIAILSMITMQRDTVLLELRLCGQLSGGLTMCLPSSS